MARLSATAAIVLLLMGACDADDRPNSFSYIHAAILKPSCATIACHGAQNSQAGVNLSTVEAAYGVLVGRACGSNAPEDGEGNYAVAFQPERSALMYLVRGEDVKRPMPPDRFLPLVDVDLIEAWIFDGARCM